jgi:hypothetical protein
VFYGSNPYRKDNPRWGIRNAAETPSVRLPAFRLLLAVGFLRDEPVTRAGPGLAAGFADWARHTCGICTAWFAGLPRRAGAWLQAATDEEARWWHWQVSERYGGLVHQYRDERFAILRRDPSVRRDELRTDLASPDAAPPGYPCAEQL